MSEVQEALTPSEIEVFWTLKNAPHGKIMKSDVSIAKNYLNEKEIKGLVRKSDFARVVRLAIQN